MPDLSANRLTMKHKDKIIQYYFIQNNLVETETHASYRDKDKIHCFLFIGFKSKYIDLRV